MAGQGAQEQFRLGFLTAMEVPEQGFVGGLLVTTRHGRPLEFQCTSPVKPNRTQELLYGPTLTPFLLGELIGRTLVEKAGVKPHLILTERGEFLDLRPHVNMPVGCLNSEAAAPSSDPEQELRVGLQRLRFHSAHAQDKSEVEKETKQVPPDADLREPFERIREALLETVRVTAPR